MNENTSHFVRRYLPKGTSITSDHPYPGVIADKLNNCPGITFGHLIPTRSICPTHWCRPLTLLSTLLDRGVSVYC